VTAVAIPAVSGATTADRHHPAHKARVVQGTPGNDTIIGKRYVDKVVALSGDDFVRLAGGNDIADGGPDNDWMHGNNGNDQISGGPGDDFVQGGNGNDRLDGGEGNDLMHGNSGNDYVYGGPGNDHPQGGPGNDHVYGGPGDDELDGDQGDDYIVAGSGDDQVTGDEGDDVIFPGPGADEIYGEEGQNKIVAQDDGVRDDIFCNQLGTPPGLIVYIGQQDPLDALRNCKVTVVQDRAAAARLIGLRR